MSEEKIEELLMGEYCEKKDYSKGRFIFFEGDRPRSLFVLLKGRVVISRSTMSGKRILITDIESSGELFGEVYLFIGKEAYDMDAQVIEDTQILEISAKAFQDVQSEAIAGKKENALLWQNLLGIFAGKAYQMSQKIKVLGCGSIREKIVRYLFERQDADGKIQGNLVREDMAEYMNITRPSLSRELGLMQREGLLKLQGREIWIADQEKFEKYL